jgi:hypothetical protein
MDNVEATDQVRREEASDKNIRYLGYNLLKNIEFEEEPVVPKILSEGKDAKGPYFNVENLPGMDVADFLELPEDEASVKDKLRVMLHIVGQFQAIDKAGFVLADRHVWNIRLLGWKDKISTRQIDVDEYYDKDADSTYSLDRQKTLEEFNDSFKKTGTDLWAPTVNSLLSAELGAIDIGRNPEIVKLLRTQKWEADTKPHGSNLIEHEEILKKAIQMAN